MRARALVLVLAGAIVPAVSTGVAQAADSFKNNHRAARVLVVPTAVSGVSELDGERLRAALVEGLAHFEGEVELITLADGPEANCVDLICMRALAERYDATHVVISEVEGAERDFDASISIYGVASDAQTAIISGCFVCGFEEFVLSFEADALRALDGAFAAAELTLVGAPERTRVSVDGSRYRPVDGVVYLAPGSHALSLRARGYEREQLALSVDPGQIEAIDLAFEPKPQRWQRPVGAVGLGLGLAGIGAGVGLLAIHGADVGSRCDDSNELFVIDSDGDCRWVHDTRAAGATTLALGVVAAAAGATLIALDIRACRRGGEGCGRREVALGVGLQRVGFHVRF